MRFAAEIEYDGTSYHGWQYQHEDIATVQLYVERAFSKVADHFVRVVCAGRTDAGVHASGQIIHFDSDSQRTERAWTFGANANLPHDISVHWVKPVGDEFHARFSAMARQYRYTIYNHPIRPAINRQFATWHCLPLDEHKMQQAANVLIGEHDFSAFRAQQCQAKSPIKTIEFLNISRAGDYIYLDIKANAFLHHMVRNIAGVLMAIGNGSQAPDWINTVLESKNRGDGGVTAVSSGLCLTKVYYPNRVD
jgi:tRNA pseudouridine38-40 synthase